MPPYFTHYLCQRYWPSNLVKIDSSLHENRREKIIHIFIIDDIFPPLKMCILSSSHIASLPYMFLFVNILNKFYFRFLGFQDSD